MYKPEINNRTNNSFSDLQGRSVSLILRSSFLQGVMSAIIIGSLFAGIWTMIPTNMLPWGSSKINILGYASHCPFAPFSSLILFGICVYGIKSVNKLGLNTSTGYMIFLFGIKSASADFISGPISFCVSIKTKKRPAGATALYPMSGVLVAVQSASLRRYDPDQVPRVVSP